MSICDLMFGDWVLWRGTPIKIMSINDKTSRSLEPTVTGLIAIDGKETIRRFNAKSLKPIPITPEILAKNGFENRGAQFLCDRICMIWWKDNIFMFSKYTRHEDLPTENISINIGYVHELQRALKLCGITKKIIKL